MIRKEISTEEAIARILSTPLGSRVMRPEYGSRLFELVDRPITDEWMLLASDYSYEAIERNEPRVELKSVRVELGERVSMLIEYKEAKEAKVLRVNLSKVSDAAA